MIKPLLSKLNFAICRNPQIVRNQNWNEFIPKPFKSVLLISADFELAWAWQYAKNHNGNTEEVRKTALLERNNVPKILKLCDTYEIPITWATVGHLFLESCKRINGVKHSEILRLPNFENDYWKFSGNDWFDNDPCSDFKNSPEWYCPDLIKLIINSKVKHEIGCHTFSHINCSDAICPEVVFDTEIEACKSAAQSFGIDLKSFVHPGHTIGNLERLKHYGFTSFRTDGKNVLSYPVIHSTGLWEIKTSASLYFRSGWSLRYHVYRYKKIIDRAIRSNTVCCLWFHPSVEEIFIDKVMSELMEYIDRKREQIFIATTAEYISWLNSGKPSLEIK